MLMKPFYSMFAPSPKILARLLNPISQEGASKLIKLPCSTLYSVSLDPVSSEFSPVYTHPDPELLGYSPFYSVIMWILPDSELLGVYIVLLLHYQAYHIPSQVT